MNSSCKGLTLIEILMGLMIMTLVAFASIKTLDAGFRMTQTSRDNTVVSQILQSEMERLRLMNWPTLMEQMPDEGQLSEAIDLAALVSPKYVNRYQLQREMILENPDLMRVRLQVRWTGVNRQETQREYFSFIARNGLSDYYYGALISRSVAPNFREIISR